MNQVDSGIYQRVDGELCVARISKDYVNDSSHVHLFSLCSVDLAVRTKTDAKDFLAQYRKIKDWPWEKLNILPGTIFKSVSWSEGDLLIQKITKASHTGVVAEVKEISTGRTFLMDVEYFRHH